MAYEMPFPCRSTAYHGPHAHKAYIPAGTDERGVQRYNLEPGMWCAGYWPPHPDKAAVLANMEARPYWHEVRQEFVSWDEALGPATDAWTETITYSDGSCVIIRHAADGQSYLVTDDGGERPIADKAVLSLRTDFGAESVPS